MRQFIKRFVEWGGRYFFVMMGAPRVRLWEVQVSDRKFSAQLAEVKSPDRERILSQIDRTK